MARQAFVNRTGNAQKTVFHIWVADTGDANGGTSQTAEIMQIIVNGAVYGDVIAGDRTLIDAIAYSAVKAVTAYLTPTGI